jgi:hypothetical protein
MKKGHQQQRQNPKGKGNGNAPNNKQQQQKPKHDYRINQFFKEFAQQNSLNVRAGSTPMNSPIRRAPVNNTLLLLKAEEIAQRINHAIKSFQFPEFSAQFTRQANEWLSLNNAKQWNLSLSVPSSNFVMTIQTFTKEEMDFVFNLFKTEECKDFLKCFFKLLNFFSVGSRLFKCSSFGTTISIEFLREKQYDLNSEGLSFKDWLQFFKTCIPENEGDSWMSNDDGNLDFSGNFIELDRNSPWFLPLE